MIRTNKRLYLSRNLMCNMWRSNESHFNKAHKSDTWFKNVVRECIKDLKAIGKTHCFSEEQLDEIRKQTNHLYVLRSYYDNDFGVHFIKKVRVKR